MGWAWSILGIFIHKHHFYHEKHGIGADHVEESNLDTAKMFMLKIDLDTASPVPRINQRFLHYLQLQLSAQVKRCV